MKEALQKAKDAVAKAQREIAIARDKVIKKEDASRMSELWYKANAIWVELDRIEERGEK